MLLPMTVPLRTLSDAVEKIVQRDPTAERKRDESGAVIKLPAGKRIQAIDIVGWLARTRTSNQTVMSGPAVPEILGKTGVFRHVHARSFASVHGVSVVNLWSVLGRCDHWRSDDALMMPMSHQKTRRANALALSIS
jgi:hypothetical protein